MFERYEVVWPSSLSAGRPTCRSFWLTQCGYNLPEDLLENVPLKLDPVAALKRLLEDPEDDTNQAVKEEIQEMYDHSAGCVLFSLS